MRFPFARYSCYYVVILLASDVTSSSRGCPQFSGRTCLSPSVTGLINDSVPLLVPHCSWLGVLETNQQAYGSSCIMVLASLQLSSIGLPIPVR
ncbi:uncharacterized protein BO80DRAFT_16276 [Aspergillus ibericus CBS 121593]|uniref:Secreted protein n=1 Tax=Aspergillus ibericus CBS 121593 TaxID=1448316 RepID=A0A395H5V3_9EURO|nr:hypothetical protein BO80DRAFT_16276 [Aspergillus ibericus CBS 121593]RAL03272.1 hypothetical protein BO80DRAFT_16276 [Aspergillus ibericus CBS 121593]